MKRILILSFVFVLLFFPFALASQFAFATEDASVITEEQLHTKNVAKEAEEPETAAGQEKLAEQTEVAEQEKLEEQVEVTEQVKLEEQTEVAEPEKLAEQTKATEHVKSKVSVKTKSTQAVIEEFDINSLEYSYSMQEGTYEKITGASHALDILVSGDYEILFSIQGHETYNVSFGYSFTSPLSQNLIPLARNEIVSVKRSDLPLDCIYVFAINEDQLVDTGKINVNQQLNKAEVIVDEYYNPSSITFENNGDTTEKTDYKWEIVDSTGKVVASGNGQSVPKEDFENLPEGIYDVTLTTSGYSQYGNKVEDAQNTAQFEIILGKLTEVHTIRELDGSLDEKKRVVTKESIGTTYSTSAMSFEGYKLVKTPENATGEYKKEDTLVEYFYEPIIPTITVNYVAEDGKVLHEPINETGVYGGKYTTEEKSFDGYELIEVPKNATGIYDQEHTEVTYVYRLAEESVASKPNENSNQSVLNESGRLPQTGMTASNTIFYSGITLLLVGIYLIRNRKRRKV